MGEALTGSLTSSAASVNEGSAVTLTANLSTAATSALNIPYTLSGTGITTGDFTGVAALTGTINVAAGATTGTLTLNVAADNTTEGAETLNVALGATAGVNLGAVTSTNVVINDTSTTPVAGTTNTVTVNSLTTAAAAANTFQATAGADTFNIAAGAYSATINNFGQSGADKLAFFPNAAITVVPDLNQTDGVQQINAVDPVSGATTTITLTGITAAQDAGAFNVPSFNTTFGAGSLA